VANRKTRKEGPKTGRFVALQPGLFASALPEPGLATWRVAKKEARDRWGAGRLVVDWEWALGGFALAPQGQTGVHRQDAPDDRLNRERLRHAIGSPEFQQRDALLRQAVESMRSQAVIELSNPRLRQPCRKALESLEEHWTGLTRFVDDSRIPMDNNASERAGRGPAVARKNFYGSGSLWSGRLAATMFSLFATRVSWKLNPRLWLMWYLESCAAAGGEAPEDIEPFLPWNLSDQRRSALGAPALAPLAHNTS
jgi:transposase